MNIASHFHSAALESPDRVALHFENEELSYGELMGIVQSLRGVVPSASRVGLLAHRSKVAYAAVQAILAAGSAYVPLKPSSPAHYNLQLIQQSDVAVLIVGSECTQALADLLKLHTGPIQIVTHGPVQAIREILAAYPAAQLHEAPLQGPGAPPAPLATPLDDLACILFTSGSTGVPKGVKILHSAVENYLDWFLDNYPITPEDRLSQIFELVFDCSLHDMFITWRARASLVVFPDRLVLTPMDFAKEKAVTCWYSVGSFPVFLESFRMAIPDALPKVRIAIFAGEKLTWNAVQIWKRVAPGSKVLNLYGPTETNVVTWFEVPENFSEAACFQGGIPIGKLLPNHSAEVRRDDGTICDPGEQGVLWVAGAQVSPGYLDPAKTAVAFVPRDGKVWYCTGDVVFSQESGDYQFLGRQDLQVKVMGYRIELGEIEAALLRETGAAFAVVDVVRAGVDELACVLPTAFSKQKKALRDALRAQFEPYMVPRVWKFQDTLPRNPNGKIDRGALRAQWAAEAAEGA